MWALLLLFGILGGILGGMGMGGGTVLIPLLSCFLGVNQHLAQATNLICFIPMSVVALIFHFKEKLVKTEGIMLIILPALVTSVLGSIVGSSISDGFLKKTFAVFLILLALSQFFLKIKNAKKDK